MTRESHRILLVSAFVFWLGLMVAPAALADDTWQQLEHSSLDALFVNVRTPLESYRTATLDPVSVWFPADDALAARQADELRLTTQDHFAAAIAARGMLPPGAGGSQDAGEPVTVRVQLIDLRALPSDGALPEWAENFRFRVAPGRVTLVAELVDAESGMTVVRMADLQDSSFAGTPAAVDRTLQHWSDVVALSAEWLPGARQVAQTHPVTNQVD